MLSIRGNATQRTKGQLRALMAPPPKWVAAGTFEWQLDFPMLPNPAFDLMLDTKAQSGCKPSGRKFAATKRAPREFCRTSRRPKRGILRTSGAHLAIRAIRAWHFETVRVRNFPFCAGLMGASLSAFYKPLVSIGVTPFLCGLPVPLYGPVWPGMSPVGRCPAGWRRSVRRGCRWAAPRALRRMTAWTPGERRLHGEDHYANLHSDPVTSPFPCRGSTGQTRVVGSVPRTPRREPGP